MNLENINNKTTFKRFKKAKINNSINLSIKTNTNKVIKIYFNRPKMIRYISYYFISKTKLT